MNPVVSSGFSPELYSQNSAIGKIPVRFALVRVDERCRYKPSSWGSITLADMLWHAAFFRNAATTSGSASLWRSASAQTRERRTGRGALRRRRDLPYSSSLFRESCEPDGLRGGSSSWRMMHSGQSAQRPLHNKFLRWAFPETCNKRCGNKSRFHFSVQFCLCSF